MAVVVEAFEKQGKILVCFWLVILVGDFMEVF